MEKKILKRHKNPEMVSVLIDLTYTEKLKLKSVSLALGKSYRQIVKEALALYYKENNLK